MCVILCMHGYMYGHVYAMLCTWSSKTTYRNQFFHSITWVLRPKLRLRQHSPLPTKHFLPVFLFCCLFEADLMYFRLVLNSLFSSNDLESLIIITLSPHEDWNCEACTPCLIGGVLEMEPQALRKPITKLSYSTSPRVSNRNQDVNILKIIVSYDQFFLYDHNTGFWWEVCGQENQSNNLVIYKITVMERAVMKANGLGLWSGKEAEPRPSEWVGWVEAEDQSRKTFSGFKGNKKWVALLITFIWSLYIWISNISSIIDWQKVFRLQSTKW